MSPIDSILGLPGLIIERAPVRGLDAHGRRRAVQAPWPALGSRPHMNVLRPFDPLNYQTGQT